MGERPERARVAPHSRTDPTRVATDFFGALTLQDWEGAVQFVAPDSLAEFRQTQLALFVTWAAKRGDVRLHAFADAPTLRELAALPADVFAARFLAAVRGWPTGYRVFGHVQENDDLAHVVYRPIQEGYVGAPLDVAVLHMRRRGDGWHVLLSRELADSSFILFHLDELDEGAEGPAPPEAY